MGLRAIDVGGKIQPYRAMLGNKFACYVPVDLVKTDRVDVLARAEELPVPDGFFDLAICTQVLKYIGKPEMAIS